MLRQEFDELAQRLVGPLVDPVPIPAQFSYTITASNRNNCKILQFRAGTSK